MFQDKFLKYLSNYVQLTSEEENLFIAKLKERKYLKGHFVSQEGDASKFVTFILSGAMQSFYVDPKGNKHTVGFAIENWWTGDLGSFISQKPAKYNVQCVEDCHVLQISKENLEDLYKELPKVERFFRILIQNAYVNSQDRLVDSMSLPTKEKYLKFRTKYVQLIDRFPQYMLASYLGCTPEFLSKIKRELSKS